MNLHLFTTSAYECLFYDDIFGKFFGLVDGGLKEASPEKETLLPQFFSLFNKKFFEKSDLGFLILTRPQLAKDMSKCCDESKVFVTSVIIPYLDAFCLDLFVGKRVYAHEKVCEKLSARGLGAQFYSVSGVHPSRNFLNLLFSSSRVWGK